jgi:uncharacterized protein
MVDIPGTPSNDILFGTPEDDRIAGRTGSDWLAGLAGNDVMKGGGDSDLLTGGEGLDLLVGGVDDDFLLAGDGGDALRGGSGADLLSGGAGNDVLLIGGGGDHLLGNAGNDAFLILPNGKLVDVFSQTEVIIDAGPEEHRFAAELAETIPQLTLGLMYRADLADDHGMLFDYGSEQPTAIHSMRNTFVPLDILFIDADGRVVTVAEQTVPLSEELIPSGEPVRAVLEVPAGTAAALGIDVGDRVLHPIFGTGDPVTDDAPGDTPDGGRAPRGGNDTIRDFTQGEDAIGVPFFGTLTFADFDTNGNGVLDDGDAPVAVADGDTVIDFTAFTPDPVNPYTLTVAGVTGLTAADLLLPGAAGGTPAELGEAPMAEGRTSGQPTESVAGAAADDEPPGARSDTLELTEVLTDPEAEEVDLAGHLAEDTNPAAEAGSDAQHKEVGNLVTVEGASGASLDNLVGDGIVPADGA